MPRVPELVRSRVEAAVQVGQTSKPVLIITPPFPPLRGSCLDVPPCWSCSILEPLALEL